MTHQGQSQASPSTVLPWGLPGPGMAHGGIRSPAPSQRPPERLDDAQGRPTGLEPGRGGKGGKGSSYCSTHVCEYGGWDVLLRAMENTPYHPCHPCQPDPGMLGGRVPCPPISPGWPRPPRILCPFRPYLSGGPSLFRS
jgi:hypothetical protein